MSRAVKAGVLQSVSPSQINEFDLCRRKWFLNKVVGLPQPPSDSQTLGESIHLQFERHFLKGEPPDHPSVQMALELAEVPKPDPSVVIEEPRNYNLGLTAAGVPMRGRIDVRLPPSNNVFTILDWKSTKSWRWLKTPDELARNPQGIVYLKYGFTLYPEAEAGVFRHVYVRTAGGWGACSVATDPLPRSHVDEMYQHLETRVEDMKVTAALEHPADVEPNLSACNAFGGCPYRDVCSNATRKSIAQLVDEFNRTSSTPTPEEGETSMSLSEKLKARKAATSSTPAPINPPDAASPAPVVSAGNVEVTSTYVQPAVMPPSPQPTESAQTLHLFVDCQPVKGTISHVSLEALIADRTPAILNTVRQSDPNAVPPNAVDVREVKFGAGTAALVASFKREPPVGVIVASSAGLSGQVVEALTPIAATVVRGMR